MILEHAALWTDNLELLKEFYTKYFDGQSNARYTNEKNHFDSYFITFQSGARLEIMSRPGIPQNLNDTINSQHKGLIHLAFAVDTMPEVDEKAKQLRAAGFTILRGPRKTGDGYYEFETLDPDNNRLEVMTRFTEIKSI